MPLMRDKQSVGLDLGPSSAKVVQVVLRGKAVEVARTALFEARGEGLLDEAELYAGTASWLKEIGLAERDVNVGLPQHLATTQISDFPPNVTGDELREMVTFETVQLAGLSDEAFASDYQVLAPEYGRKNPVLIGMCRQSAVDERNAAFAEAGMRVRDIAMEGLAAANALFFLHPEAQAEKAPQVILDIGAETSSMLVLGSGQVLFVGALLFGAERFAKAAAQAELDGLSGAALTLDGPAESPLQAVYRQLESEIRNGLEHWRAGEKADIAGAALARLWLCGGGAGMAGLSARLSQGQGCPAAVFGPAGENGQPDPRLAMALGLALQGLGQAAIPISLCPEVMRWSRLRRERFGYLLAASAIFLGLAVFFMIRHSHSLDRRSRDLGEQVANLRRCRDLIPKLEENYQLIQHHEKMLLPIVEKANRGGRFLKTIQALEQARGEGDWFIYLADEFSFEEGKPKDEKTAEAAAATPRPTPQELLFPGTIASLDSSEGVVPASTATVVTAMSQMKSMVMAGHSPKTGGDFLGSVKAIRDKLNANPLFKGADILPKPERVGREEEIFQPWITYLRTLAERRITGPYVSYMFRLPFATLDVNKAPPPPPPPPKSSRRSRSSPSQSEERVDDV